MLRLEAARTELKAVQMEMEKVKLREARLEQVEAVDQAVEVEWLKELYAQVEAVWHKLDNTQQRLKLQETAAQKLQSKCQALE